MMYDDCVLDDAVHMEPGAHLASRVHVGRATTIGIGAVVVKGRRIGAHSHVGAGAVKCRDSPPRPDQAAMRQAAIL